MILKVRPDDFLEAALLDRRAWKDNLHGEYIPDGEHVWRIWAEYALMYKAVDQAGGMLGLILAFRTEDDSYCVHKVMVQKGYRRKGTGSQLFERLLSEIDQRGKRAFLTVDPANRAAIHLYEKWGFVKGELVSGYYRAYEDRYVMWRHEANV